MSEPGLVRAVEDKQAEENLRQRSAQMAAWARAHKFQLRTSECYYPKSSDVADALEALGFDFSDNGSPHDLTKVGNPKEPFTIETMNDLRSFVDKHGPVAITGDGELIILGGHAHYLPKLCEVGQRIEGYTSVGFAPFKPNDHEQSK